MRRIYDSEGRPVEEKPSLLQHVRPNEQAELFEKLTQGVLEYDKEEIQRCAPDHIGKDFLVYRLPPAKNIAESVSSVIITVGRVSLLPVQMKIFYREKKDDYDFYIFDYERERASRGEMRTERSADDTSLPAKR
jgi:hypothetical protein